MYTYIAVSEGKPITTPGDFLHVQEQVSAMLGLQDDPEIIEVMAEEQTERPGVTRVVGLYKYDDEVGDYFPVEDPRVSDRPEILIVRF